MFANLDIVAWRGEALAPSAAELASATSSARQNSRRLEYGQPQPALRVPLQHP